MPRRSPPKKSVLVMTPCSLGAQHGLPGPIAVERPARGDVPLGLLGLVEPVREDLVHHAAFQPVGGLEVFVVHRQLPLVVAAEDAVPGKAPGEPLAAPVGAHLKVIEIEAGRFRGKVAFPPLLGISVHAAPEQIQHLDLTALPLDDEMGGRTAQLSGERDAEMDGGAVRHGPKRVPVFPAAGIKHAALRLLSKISLRF